MATKTKEEIKKTENTVFNDAQLYMLQLMSKVKTKKELNDIKSIVCSYYEQKANKMMDDMCKKGRFSSEEINELRNAHLRKSK